MRSDPPSHYGTEFIFIYFLFSLKEKRFSTLLCPENKHWYSEGPYFTLWSTTKKTHEINLLLQNLSDLRIPGLVLSLVVGTPKDHLKEVKLLLHKREKREGTSRGLSLPDVATTVLNTRHKRCLLFDLQD